MTTMTLGGEWVGVMGDEGEGCYGGEDGEEGRGGGELHG
jgi:hypothetical protein